VGFPPRLPDSFAADRLPLSGLFDVSRRARPGHAVKKSQRLDQIRDFSKIKSWLFTTLRRHFLLKIRRYKQHPEVQFLSDAHDFRAEDPEVWKAESEKCLLYQIQSIGFAFR
jgi:hypothetical protein